MLLNILTTISLALGAYAIFDAIRRLEKIKSAETQMVALLKIECSLNDLEKMRSDLLSIKKEARRLEYQDMHRFYDIEHQLNLVTIKLDRISRQLIEQGLQQPRDESRLEYMLKLVTRSVA